MDVAFMAGFRTAKSGTRRRILLAFDDMIADRREEFAKQSLRL